LGNQVEGISLQDSTSKGRRYMFPFASSAVSFRIADPIQGLNVTFSSMLRLREPVQIRQPSLRRTATLGHSPIGHCRSRVPSDKQTIRPDSIQPIPSASLDDTLSTDEIQSRFKVYHNHHMTSECPAFGGFPQIRFEMACPVEKSLTR
jgi:hypothetical protein